MSVDVVILADGYSRYEKNNMLADATCTLVKTSDELILVDTLGPWNADKLISLINKQGFHIEDITYVVCTHGHSDHLGNLNLFTNKTQSMAIAIQNQLNPTSLTNDNLSNETQKRSKIKKHFVGNTIYYDDEYFCSDEIFKDKLFKINDNIQIRQTPGHTLTCISLLVSNTDKGKIAICGDLFENKSDLNHDLIWLAQSESEELQRLNRKFILDNYDYIVPGHGEMFKI